MSVDTVARSDFKSVRRSSVVVGVLVAFVGMVALMFMGSSSAHPEPVRTTWGLSALVVWVFPLLIAPLTYLAIAGDRERGSIKYHLGLPNSRGEYFLAKYVSRAGVATAAMALGVGTALVVATATYDSAPDIGRFLVFGTISVLFALAMAGVFVAVSAAVTTRSRAMFGVFGAYFLLSAFWVGFLPVLNLGTVLDAVGSIPGVTVSDSARAVIAALSPAGAYFNLLPELVWSDVLTDYDTFATFTDRPDYLGYEAWFNLLVLGVWAVGAPLLGYLRFRSAELG